MINSKKGSSDTFQIITGVIISLLILYFAVTFVFGKLGQADNATTCENIGGVIASICDPEVSITKPQNDEDVTGNCCIKSPLASQTDFDNWKKEIGTNKDKTGEDETSSTANTFIIPENRVGQDFIQLFFGITDVTGNNEPISWRVNVPYEVEGINGIKKADYCQIHIFRNDLAGRTTIKTVENTNCGLPASDRAIKLNTEGEFKEPGSYKVDFVLKTNKDGNQLASATTIVNVEPEPTPIYLLDRNPPQVILNGKQVQQEYRNNINYCFIQAGLKNVLDTTEAKNLEYQYKLIDRTRTCDYAELSTLPVTAFNYASQTGGLQLNTNQKLCLEASYEYEFTFEDITQRKTVHDRISITSGNQVLQSDTIPGCDQIIIVENTGLIGSTQTCEYTSCAQLDQNTCTLPNRVAGGNGCVFGLDCYYKQTDVGKLFNADAGSCVACEDKSIDKCRKYKNQESCEENACIPTSKCAWDQVNSRCGPVI